MLTQALAGHEAAICGCGCGQWAADAHNLEFADQWIVDDATCYARRALDSWAQGHPDQASSAVLTLRLGSRLSPEEQAAEFMADIAEAYRRHGLEPPG